MRDTPISWAEHTFNPWWGCSRVSRACRNCYADTLAHRWGFDVFRRGGPRRFMSDAYWRNPHLWNRDAAAAGVPVAVFCMSMGDLFEIHPDPTVAAQQERARQRLWRLIPDTPWLTWLLLTKRIEHVMDLVPWDAGTWPVTVWVGASTENQELLEYRTEHLARVPAPVRFVSAEPLVGPPDLSGCLSGPNPVNWVISGGESGPDAVASHPDWFRSLRDQCVTADVPYHHKQWGEWAPQENPDWPIWDAWLHPHRHCWVHPGTGATIPVGEFTGTQDGLARMYRVGTKLAGRRVDGRQWSQRPPLWTPDQVAA